MKFIKELVATTTLAMAAGTAFSAEPPNAADPQLNAAEQGAKDFLAGQKQQKFSDIQVKDMTSKFAKLCDEGFNDSAVIYRANMMVELPPALHAQPIKADVGGLVCSGRNGTRATSQSVPKKPAP